jgi:hypothetical protein
MSIAETGLSTPLKLSTNTPAIYQMWQGGPPNVCCRPKKGWLTEWPPTSNVTRPFSIPFGVFMTGVQLMRLNEKLNSSD